MPQRKINKKLEKLIIEKFSGEIAANLDCPDGGKGMSKELNEINSWSTVTDDKKKWATIQFGLMTSYLLGQNPRISKRKARSLIEKSGLPVRHLRD